jgi:hypothetical protein
MRAGTARRYVGVDAAASDPCGAGARLRARRGQVGDAALLVDGRDAASIARGLDRVWTDAALRTDLAARGKGRSARWTEAEFGERLREIVRKAVGAH